MTRPRHLACALFVLAITLAPASALAHPSETSFRLGLGLPALSVTHFPDPDVTQITYGVYPVTFGLHLGVQVASEIGFAVHLYGGGLYLDNPGADDLHIVLAGFVPRFEYMLTPHDVAAPYFGVEVGLEVSGDPDLDLRDLFRTGGFFGLHLFAVTEFSIDLELALNFVYDVDADLPGIRGVFYVSTTGWLS